MRSMWWLLDDGKDFCIMEFHTYVLKWKLFVEMSLL